MKIGVSGVLTAVSTDVAVVARRAEELGFDSLWLGEHPIMPVSYASLYPGSPEGVLPPGVPDMVDPLVALARAVVGIRFCQ